MLAPSKAPIGAPSGAPSKGQWWLMALYVLGLLGLLNVHCLGLELEHRLADAVPARMTTTDTINAQACRDPRACSNVLAADPCLPVGTQRSASPLALRTTLMHACSRPSVLTPAPLFRTVPLPFPPSQPTAYDQETGRARGFAHVEFADGAAAASAAAKNGEIELDGRTLRLDLSAGRGAGGNTPSGNRGGQPTDGTTVFVKGFDTSGGFVGVWGGMTQL